MVGGGPSPDEYEYLDWCEENRRRAAEGLPPLPRPPEASTAALAKMFGIVSALLLSPLIPFMLLPDPWNAYTAGALFIANIVMMNIIARS